MHTVESLRLLTRYKAWANGLIFEALAQLPELEILRRRQTRFGNMVHTLNHVFVIDAVFKAHMLGLEHGYSARNTPDHPPLAELQEATCVLDAWYVAFADQLTAEQASEVIPFFFIGGGEGRMSRAEMILHLVNHGSYHRGLVADMMYQARAEPPATDLPVFLRDVHRPVD